MLNTCRWCLGHGRHDEACPEAEGRLDEKRKEAFLAGNLDFGTVGNQAERNDPSYLLGARMAEVGHILD